MPSITSTQLAKRVLQHIGVLDASQTPTAEELELALEAFESVLSEVSVEGLSDGILASDVPDWAQPMFRDLMAYQIGSSFGVQVDPMLRNRALTRLRQQQAQSLGYINAPVRRSPFL